MNARTAAALVILGAAMAGLIGPFDRILTDYGMKYTAIAFCRSAVTVLALLIVIMITDKKLFKINKKHIPFFILLGIFKYVMDVTYMSSLNEVSLALSTVLQMTAPYFIILFSFLIFKDKVSKRKMIAVILGTVSACMISNLLTNSGNITLLGVSLGLISGMTFAGYMMTTSFLVNKGYSGMTTVFYAFLIATIASLPTAPIVNTVETIAQHNDAIWGILVLGIGCTLLPYLFDTVGVKYMDATSVTVFSMVEIVVASIIGFFMYNEPLGAPNIVGMVILLVSMLLINDKKQEHDDPKGKPPENVPPPPQ